MTPASERPRSDAPREARSDAPREDPACVQILSESAAQTERIGARLAADLRPGDVVLLEGELGAGKTTFVRGACRALGVSATVTSPTFTIAQRYSAPVPVAHVDLYRIVALAGEQPELLADYISPSSIAFVEWPGGARDELAALGRIAATVSIEHAGQDRRRIEISPGDRPRD